MFPAPVQVTWKVTLAQIGAGQYKRSVLLISLFVIIWKILYSTIFKLSISYRLVFFIWFCPDRHHRKGVIKIRLRAVSYFSLDTVECEHARGASGKSARNEGWLVHFSQCIGILVLVFLLSSVLFHNSDCVTGLFFLKYYTLLPTTLENGKVNNWAYFYGKCPAKNASLQCRRFLWACNLLAKAPCWNFPKRGGNGAPSHLP